MFTGLVFHFSFTKLNLTESKIKFKIHFIPLDAYLIPYTLYYSLLLICFPPSRFPCFPSLSLGDGKNQRTSDVTWEIVTY